MLTLIAYRFMVGAGIPVIPYLTRMDLFILGSTILVFLALIQAVLTSLMLNSGKAKRARWLDRVCRLLFPAVFLAMIYFSLTAN